MAYIDQISNNFYQSLRKNLQRLKYFFQFQHPWLNTKLRGEVVRIGGNRDDKWRDSKSRGFTDIKIELTTKNKRLQVDLTTPSKFDQVWSKLNSLLQSYNQYTGQRIELCERMLYAALFISFLFINLSQRFNKNDVIRSCFSNIQFFIYVCIHFSPFQSACFLCIEKKNRYPTRFSSIFY